MAKSVILCVDDEKVVLNSLKTQLKESFGDLYQYEIAEDAIEALELIDELDQEDVSILVIVSDWLMPGMKGDEFLVQVHQRFPRVVKVMLTGQANPEAIQRVQREANLHSCLFKPWSEAELIHSIKTGLAQS